MKLPKINELRYAIKALFSKAMTTKFPFEKHTPFPGFRGRPEPNDEKCIACGACAQVCPSGAIEVIDHAEGNDPKRDVIWHYDLCMYCGQCELLCTTKEGVKLGPEYDLSTFDRSTLSAGVTKELIVCKDCGEIIGPREHLMWLFERLGPLAFGNFNLIYVEQKDMNLTSEIPGELVPPPIQRQDLYRLLCPKCRHIVLDFNQTAKQP
ncbi:MAG: 4Fe-4S binding protein [Endomicrobiales bacterium]|nr:4Fe-4S binding protein [Endomicrobiales bacterium]